MHQHLDELKDIDADEAQHTQSVFSMSTTLEGIRAVCEMVERKTDSGDSLLDSVDVNDILMFLNIIGLACEGPIGTFPDPMSWRVNKLYLGVYCSLSDVLRGGAGGSQLTVPRGFQGYESKENENNDNDNNTDRKEAIITNVIPFFDDPRVCRFLKKYAPRLLEYSAGQGMRRILGAVNSTFLYTIAAGLWQLIGQLDKDRTDITLKTFVNMTETFSVESGHYFDHLLPFLNDQPAALQQNLSYYIHNTGITNMLTPMYKLITNNAQYQKAMNDINNSMSVDSSSSSSSSSSSFSFSSVSSSSNTLYSSLSPQERVQKLIPRILRALYSYEIWQSVKRTYKNRDNADVLAQEKLDSLLGIDLEKHKTSLRPLFEAEPDADHPPAHHDQYHTNQKELKDYIRGFWYLDQVVLIPSLLAAASKKDFKALADLPKLSNELICQTLGINYDLNKFRFYNVVHALMFTSKSSRVDDKNYIMKIMDLQDEKKVEEFLQNYVRQKYANKYASEKAFKGKTEREQLKNQLVEKMVESKTKEDLLVLFKEGLTIGCTNWKIVNSCTNGFVEFRNKLLDTTIEVPLRLQKISILLLGKNPEDGTEVWNNGHSLFCMDLRPYEAIFQQSNKMELWNNIKSAHRVTNRHEYRGNLKDNKELTEKEILNLRNRHDHGNDRSSYWAMGYPTLESMIESVRSGELTEEDFAAYCDEHKYCCGVERIVKGIKGKRAKREKRIKK